MKRKLLSVLLFVTVALIVSGCGSSQKSADGEIKKYTDQRLTGNWSLSNDEYEGNHAFEYMMITFGEKGTYSAEAKTSDKKEVIPITGTYTVDENWNMYIKKESGEEILYTYTLEDGFLLLHYMENGTAKLKKDNSNVNPLVGEWSLDIEKSGVTGGVSQLKFDNDYNVKWLLSNQGGVGTQLLEGTYTATNSELKLAFTESNISASEPLIYKIEGDYLVIGAMYYKSSSNLDFTPTPSPTESAASQLTLGQKNALAKAKSYLNSSSFSYTGLIEQLEYSGFTAEEASFAADNCGADWNEQAAKKAQSYLNSSSFSRDRLLEQLQYSGFTAEQSEYGVTQVGY